MHGYYTDSDCDSDPYFSDYDSESEISFPGYTVSPIYDDIDLETEYVNALDRDNARDVENRVIDGPTMFMCYTYYSWNPKLSELLYMHSLYKYAPMSFDVLGHMEYEEGKYGIDFFAAEICLLATGCVNIYFNYNRRRDVRCSYDYRYDYMRASKMWLHREMIGRSSGSLKRELIEELLHPRRVSQWVFNGNDPIDYLQ